MDELEGSIIPDPCVARDDSLGSLSGARLQGSSVANPRPSLGGPNATRAFASREEGARMIRALGEAGNGEVLIGATTLRMDGLGEPTPTSSGRGRLTIIGNQVLRREVSHGIPSLG